LNDSYNFPKIGGTGTQRSECLRLFVQTWVNDGCPIRNSTPEDLSNYYKKPTVNGQYATSVTNEYTVTGEYLRFRKRRLTPDNRSGPSGASHYRGQTPFPLTRNTVSGLNAATGESQKMVVELLNACGNGPLNPCPKAGIYDTTAGLAKLKSV